MNFLHQERTETPTLAATKGHSDIWLYGDKRHGNITQELHRNTKPWRFSPKRRGNITAGVPHPPATPPVLQPMFWAMEKNLSASFLLHGSANLNQKLQTLELPVTFEASDEKALDLQRLITSDLFYFAPLLKDEWSV